MFINTTNTNWVRKLSIMIVYLLFLTVQVFFNFDIGRKYFAAGSNVFFVNAHASQITGHSAKASTNTPSKSKLRLNKRFQPPAVAYTVTAFTRINIAHTAPEKIGSYISRKYSPVFLSLHSRRGPPAVA